MKNKSIINESIFKKLPEPKGSKTEIALLEMLQRYQINYEKIREKNPVIQKFPFSSARKRMGVILKNENKQRLLVKGI